MPQQAKKSLALSIYFALAVSTLLVFWQVRNFDFINYDDTIYVYENQHVLKGVTIDGIVWAFTTGCSANWHPLTWLSLMLDCQLFGPNPGMIHLMNVLLHLVNTLLLFAVLKKMTGSPWPSAFVAAAFALHPMHVESVAWIAERKDVLSTLFLLLTLAAYVGYTNRPSVFRYVITLVTFALGLMTKPMLVTLPFLLLLLDYWPLNRLMPQMAAHRQGKSAPAADGNLTLRRLIIEKIPFFVLTIVSSIITFLVQRSAGAVNDIDILSLNDNIANIFLSYAEYMSKMVWPINLAVFYPFNTAAGFPFRPVAICALLLLGISFFVIRLGRNQRYLPVGWFWFVGTLIPVIGIVQVGAQAMADRYTYIPYIGLFLMLAWGIPQLIANLPYRKVALGMLMLIVLTALGICAHRQVSYWNNSITLFSHALAVTQNNFIANTNLGNAYIILGRYQEAIKSYKQAIEIKPDSAMAHYNLGIACANLGLGTEAIEAIKQAIKIKPNDAEVYNNIGVAYDNLGRYSDAIEAFEQAVKIKPDCSGAYHNLGIIYGRLGRLQESVEACRQAIKIKPDDYDAYYNLGITYGRLNRFTDAIEAHQQAVKIKPDYAEAYNNLGAAYGNLDRLTDSIEAYQKAVKIKPDYTEAHNNLGYAYLATGDKNSALAEYNILKSLNSRLADDLFKKINK
jgi:tetratricopeptide (TPR) repeat protein